MRTFSLIFAAQLFFVTSSRSLDTNQIVNSWLASQTNIQTWSADFVQTRALKALTQPLTATGRVWFAAPNKFRWELGNPAQTIALRQTNELLLVYPKLKRVEKYPLSGGKMGQWRDALALLEAGFPRSRSELDAQFRIISLQTSNSVADLGLSPKSAAARKFMPEIHLMFDSSDQTLKGTELAFSDGSRLRNDFSGMKKNPELPPDIFSAPTDPSFRVVEPIK